MHVNHVNSNIISALATRTHTHAHTRLSVVECRRLQLLFVYVYEPAVKERPDLGKALYGGMRCVCV